MLSLIFDLDGTLVDTVYAHVFSWQRALAEAGMAIDGWRIHRRMGMSGGLFTRAVARELGREITSAEADALQHRHGELFHEFLPVRSALPGAIELLRFLREKSIPHGIATSGRRPEIDASLGRAWCRRRDTCSRARRRAAGQARSRPVPQLSTTAGRAGR